MKFTINGTCRKLLKIANFVYKFNANDFCTKMYYFYENVAKRYSCRQKSKAG